MFSHKQVMGGILAAAICASVASATTTYTVTTLDVPNAKWTVPMGINDAGQIVGHYTDTENLSHGFVLSGGNFKTLDYPGAWQTAGMGMNNKGKIVGRYYTGGRNVCGANEQHPFMFSNDTDQYSSLPEKPGAVQTTALGINDSGQIVGDTGENCSDAYGYLLSGGTFQTIKDPGFYATVLVSGINNAGDIVGTGTQTPGAGGGNGFLLSGGAFTPINYLGVSSNTYATGINDLGQIVGAYCPGRCYVFLYRGGTYTTVDIPGAVEIHIPSPKINSQGVIVGSYIDAGGNQHGFVATPSAVADVAGPVTSSLSASPIPAAVNTFVSLSATEDDASTGGSDIASASYSIDGGEPVPMALFPTGTATAQASASLSFSQSNVYTVCVRGADAAANTGADACVLLPIYDPDAGFVTGGGSIQAGAGTDLANPAASGTATFAFVSKYLPGRSVPSGNLQFHFRSGNLHFQSTIMDWLVVTGQPRAMFHGSGMINGTYACQFQVDAWDGSFSNFTVTNTDAFGIKIYSCQGGGGVNGSRYSIDPTPLAGGSIIVHQ